ncbi:MAG: carboxymuconolactone decarboxylase family protein [Dehalococcoidia bacterium]|nr:carboxymuconolactone decarboxylase family protein [Dehalococcoidia bacterium]
MSWIREAEERLHWANVINVMSINPKAMKAVNDLNNAITFGSSALSRTQEEAIATAVSVQNECRF